MRLLAFGALYFLLSLALFVGLLVVPEPDSYGNAYVPAALLILAVASVGVGFALGRWRACWLAALVWLAALATDLLWHAGVIDRSDEYEPLPLAFTIPFWSPWLLPGVAALIALGVAVRRARRQAMCASTLTIVPPGSSTKKRRTPHGSSVSG